MKKTEIEQLLEVHSNPCISIIIPTHHTSPDRIVDRDVIRDAVYKAKQLLTEKTETAVSSRLSAKIDELVSKIDFLHTSSGAGIYVSAGISKTIYFTLPVAEKVVLGNTFESRDLLFELSRMTGYFVLSVSREKINLYQGEGEVIHRIKNDDFPMEYEETYEYAKTSPGTSFSSGTLKSYEKDKSFLQEVRMKDFMRHADNILGKYINVSTPSIMESIPLVLAGDSKEIADFKSISKHNLQIIGTVPGNYLNDEKQLALLSRKFLLENIKRKNAELVAHVKELIGKGMVAVDIEESKRAAEEGMGMELLVERDLVYPTDKKIKTSDACQAIDEVIDIVREKDGDIVILENGDLKEFHGMALLLRYNNR